jgi:hypothetical protein
MPAGAGRSAAVVAVAVDGFVAGCVRSSKVVIRKARDAMRCAAICKSVKCEV